MLRPFLAAWVAGATLLGAAAAQAGPHWSIGISLPPADVVLSSGPRHYVPERAPVYYAPPPVVYHVPRPVYREVYYAPPRLVYEKSYRDRHWDRRGHKHHRHQDRHHHRWDGRGSDRDDHDDHDD